MRDICTEAFMVAPRHLTLGRVFVAAALAAGIAATSLEASAKETKKGPVDEVAERYKQARTPKKESPPGPVILSQDDCRSFAKDFTRAGEKEKGRELDGLFNAGVVYDQCGMEKQAEEIYRQVLGRNPKFQSAMNNLGVIYFKAGQRDAALAQFESALKVDPKSLQAVQAYNNKGAILYERGRQGNKAAYDEAIGALRRALAVDAESMAAYQILAQIYYQTAEADRSKLKLAQLVCDEAKKINADFAPIYNTLGLIKLRNKEVSGALGEFKKAASLDPGLTEAQLNIGAISLSARTYKQAEDAFKLVLQKQPNNMDAIIGMGVAMRGQRKPDEAESWYRKAQQLDPRNCTVLFNLGLLYQDYKSGADDWRKGQDFYNKYIACGRTDPEKVADARRRIKDIDDTFKALEEAKKIEAEAKKIEEEMKRMEKLQEEQMKQLQQQQQQQGGAAPAGGAGEKK